MGPQGMSGANGETPVVTELLSSNLDCPTGGVKISLGGNDYFACNGAAGIKGDQGEAGPMGAKGDKGDTGDTGATGLLSSGNAAGVMPYWNGSAWALNGTNLFNNGGDIGIGTSSPDAALDVRSATVYGAFSMQDGSQGLGKVLSSDADGKATWVTNVAVTAAVIGTLGSGYTGDSTATQATGSYIDLPAGKWSVQASVLLAATNPPTSGQAIWARLWFSDSATGNATGDYVGGAGTLISGSFVGPAPLALASGTVVINNTSGASKRYYLVKGTHDNAGSGYTVNFDRLGGSVWGENNIVAYPMN